MRKLVLLKTLVDFIWIVTCIPLIPILIFLSVYIFFINQPLSNWLPIDSLEDNFQGFMDKVLFFLIICFVLLLVYCFYLFRKTLRKFQQRKPFDDFVIQAYGKIGKLMTISGITISVIVFLSKMFYKGIIEIHLGLTPYVFIIVLGLFFMILSEVFLIAKTAKEENELTI